MKRWKSFAVFAVLALCAVAAFLGITTAYKNTRTLAFDDNDKAIYFYQSEQNEIVLKFYDSKFNLSNLENKLENLLSKGIEEIKSIVSD